MTYRPECPIWLNTRIALSTSQAASCRLSAIRLARSQPGSQDLARALRKLRNSPSACHDCARKMNCQARQSLNQSITIAIQEINHEWGLVCASFRISDG